MIISDLEYIQAISEETCLDGGLALYTGTNILAAIGGLNAVITHVRTVASIFSVAGGALVAVEETLSVGAE